MEKQTQVLDASVIVKWFINETDSEKAIELWKNHVSGEIKIVVPNLIFSEIINSLRYKGNDEKSLLEINKSLWNSEFIIENVNEQILQNAIIIAKKYDLTIYDSIYVAIAHLNGSSLITADKELFKIPNVVDLSKI